MTAGLGSEVDPFLNRVVYGMLDREWEAHHNG